MCTDRDRPLTVVWVRTLAQRETVCLAVLWNFFLEGMGRASVERQVLKPTVSRDGERDL